MNTQEPKADNLKKQSRRIWLRNAAIALTGAVLLIFTGCTKDPWLNVKANVPGSGGLGSNPDTWYNLKVLYLDQFRFVTKGYVSPFWEYMAVKDRSRFKLYPGENGFTYLQLEGGDWLSLSYAGWAYHSDKENRVGWKIVNGKMYSDYSRWKDYPLGCQWKMSIYGFEAYYVGVNLMNGNEFVCELTPAP